MVAATPYGPGPQCPPPDGLTRTPQSLSNYSDSTGFTTSTIVDDEGMTSTPIPLGFNFPMGNHVGTLDQIWVSINGHIFLTDSALLLPDPHPAGCTFGMDLLDEMRGDAVGEGPRIAVIGDDQEGAPASNGTFEIRVDTSIPGQVTVSWIDIMSYAASTTKPMWNFGCTLYSTGVVQMRYGVVVEPTNTRYVGMSIGNGVGSTTSAGQDLNGGTADSGTESLLFEVFGTTNPFDLANTEITFAPNGTGGWVAAQTSTGVCVPAFHQEFGIGCYSPLPSSVYELYADSAAAKATLDGNAVLFAPTGDGYTALWVPAGASAFVPPSVGATTVPIFTSNGAAVLTPSIPFPIPGGSAPNLTVSENGIVTCASTPNNGIDTTPAGADMTTSTAAPDLGFYAWRDYTLGVAGSGVIKYEEVAIGPDPVLCITWDGVESLPTTLVNPTTLQFQFNLNTGTVQLLVVDFDSGNSTADVLVGCTLAGLGTNPGSSSLPTDLPIAIAPEQSPTAYQLFPDSPTAKLALDGNRMTAVPTVNGYTLAWVPGGASAYIAPTGGATTYFFASNGANNVTPSVAFPTPFGAVPTLTISENGILTAGPSPNNGTSTAPSATSLISSTAPDLGFYCWRDFTLSEVGSGPIQSEEVTVGPDTVLCVTWNGVEAAPSTAANPTTFQFQLNLNTGVVDYIWVSYDSSTSTGDTLIGLTLPGTITDGSDSNLGSIDLATALPITLKPIDLPLSLSASPAPAITGGGTGPAVSCTYTVKHVPEFPGFPGIGACNLIFSVGPPIPGGLDLGTFPVDIGMPGCRTYISSPDAFVDISGVIAGGPGGTLDFTIAMPQPLTPGLEFQVQAIALLAPGTPATGSNMLVGTPYGARTSNGLTIHYEIQ